MHLYWSINRSVFNILSRLFDIFHDQCSCYGIFKTFTIILTLEINCCCFLQSTYKVKFKLILFSFIQLNVVSIILNYSKNKLCNMLITSLISPLMIITFLLYINISVSTFQSLDDTKLLLMFNWLLYKFLNSPRLIIIFFKCFFNFFKVFLYW